jgi:hypothetical protein
LIDYYHERAESLPGDFTLEYISTLWREKQIIAITSHLPNGSYQSNGNKFMSRHSERVKTKSEYLNTFFDVRGLF